MNRFASWPLLLATVFLSGLAAANPEAGTLDVTAAVETEADGGTGSQEDTVSADEAAEIQRALQSDAQATPASGPTPSPPPAQGLAGVFQSMNPDLSFISDVALAVFSDENLQTGGHDPTRTGFNLQQLELAVGASVDPYFRFDANLVFFQEGVEIEEVYATTLALPYGLQGRVGQFLTRFGRQNGTHVHTWDFVDQHFALGRIFGAEGNRGLGTELSYLTPLPWYVEVSGSLTEAGGEATARSFYGSQDLGVSSPLHFQSTGAIKQFFEPSEAFSVLWGLSAATGPNSSGRGNRTDVWGTDLYLKYRPLTSGDPTIVSLQTEWFYRRRQLPHDLLSDLSGYATLFWRFDQRWGTALRYEYGSPALLLDGAVAAERDSLDPEWTADRHRVSANVTFWPTEFSRLRAQVSADFPRWRSTPIYAAFLAMEFSVGAHAAHKF
ncbi:MAG: zinc-regulated TonB-dependent outer membrane receptor [Myxococcota bacterium]|nr:zinc-regulated TonB-dependent outer membrane receptor [Myxococcota bacterium]